MCIIRIYRINNGTIEEQTSAWNLSNHTGWWNSLSAADLDNDGDIDIVHEVWEGAFGASFDKAVATGGVIDLLTHDAVTREDWWYPVYIEEVCP